MATYFPSSNNQRDAAPTLYSEAPVLSGNMMMYMNYSASPVSYSDTLARNSQQQNISIDMPSLGPSDSTPPQQEFLSNPGGSRMVEHDLSSWRGRNEMVFMHPMEANTGILQGGLNLQGQGLSLSLSTHVPSGIQMPSIQYGNPNAGFSSFLSPNPSISGEGSGRNGSLRDDESSQSKQLRNAEYMPPGFLGSNPDSIKMDLTPYGMSNNSEAFPNSKYLKAAQQLLDEVVNVWTALKQKGSKKELMKGPKDADTSKSESTLPSAAEASLNLQESSSNSPRGELSVAERQDLQNKLVKLLSMLDEVDRRYKQYYHQMQIVVSSFDMMAGGGAAKPYTAVALQTISRHFRCLRDAITGQIQVIRKSLGEQDASAGSRGVGIPRLRYVDQHLKQQRALQQLGMMQQHAWRPQRGLPESSVSILRAWLFEHFLHPYPKDSDKILLARQTGLTRSQVSNWFINARVRLWKPMVEEMYKEEIIDAEMESNSSSEIVPKEAKGDAKASEDRGDDLQQSATSAVAERCSPGQNVPDAEMAGPNSDAFLQNGTPGETEIEYGAMKSRVEQGPGVDDHSGLFQNTLVQSSGSNERFLAAAAAYHMSELGSYGSGNGVSLTLGLQQHEGGSVPMSMGTHHSFIAMRGDEVYNSAVSFVGPETADFDCTDSGNRQHRFGSSHLLHDFVA